MTGFSRIAAWIIVAVLVIGLVGSTVLEAFA